MKVILFTVFLATVSCVFEPKQKVPADQSSTSLVAASGHADSHYQWRQLVESAPWKKSYNFQMFAIGDTLWTFHPDGSWWSVNGTSWQKSSLPNGINNLAFLDYVYFNKQMLGLGYFNGNIEQFQFKPQIVASGDFKKWQTLAGTSNLLTRFFYHPFVFQNKIWIVGGEDKHTKYADIWNSADGVNWQQVKKEAAFGKRSGSQVVPLKGKLYLLDNDVWSSEDGLDWKQETEAIVKGQQIFGYNAIVFDEKIWLLGCNRNGQFTSQVLASGDGKTWETHDAPWSARGGIAATTKNGKVYMTGGKYGGTPNHPDFRYSNDVWVLEKK